jgi:hypothetical protein
MVVLTIAFVLLSLTTVVLSRPQTDELNDLFKAGNICEVTESLSRQSLECIFPFKYGGKTYYGCTTDVDPDQLAWCSTKVNLDTGDHIDGEGHWGHCVSPLCPADETAKDATEILTELENSNCFDK